MGILGRFAGGGGSVTFALIKALLGAADSAIDFNGQKLSNIGTPTANTDATTKAYVDGLTGSGYAIAGDVTGTLGASTVAKVNGIACTGTPAAGAVLRATSTSAAAWGALDLANTNAVTGVLPAANRAAPTAAEVLAVVGNAMRQTCGLRLTLTSGTAVTTSDVTAAGTLYFTPCDSNMIALYNGSTWDLLSTAEVSLSLTLTSGSVYDVFAYNNSGTVTLETLVWTNATTRATALVAQDGILCKTGALTRRWIGTIKASGTNTTEDSNAKRYVFNAYCKRRRVLKPPIETADNWLLVGSGSYVQANGNSANQVDYVFGDASTIIDIRVKGLCSGTAGLAAAVGVGIDSTGANSAQVFGGTSSTALQEVTCSYIGTGGGLGAHYAAWLNSGDTGGNVLWRGDAGDATHFQQGMIGTVWM